MATVREGQASALLVVDVQQGVMAGCWDAPRVVGCVAQAVALARQQPMPVIWVQHADDDELLPGSAAWQWVPALQPAPDEIRVHKRHNSAFEQTPLEGELARLGISHLVLCGAATNWCIRATAYAALERGYDLTLVADAHTTAALEPAPGVRLPAEPIVQELNATLPWLSWPGRRCRVLPVAALAGQASGHDAPPAQPRAPAAA
jgi:nicotinamidase-related amidase